MIRLPLIAACVVVALVVAPYALGNPAFNSADAILALSPMGVLAVGGWPRRRSAGPRPASQHYRQADGSGRDPRPAHSHPTRPNA